MMRKIPYALAILVAFAGVGLYLLFLRHGGTFDVLQTYPEPRPLNKTAVDVIQAYHRSQFFRYAEFIASSVQEVESNAKINLDTVLGGVVPHHIPTTIPLLAEFYAKLKNTRDVKTFVILAPDHVDGGRGDISVSKANFVMPFATLKPDLKIIEKLEKTGFVAHDEAPFDREHSVDSQLLLISKLFPDARIVPLIFRSSITNETAKAFGRVLASVVNDDAFIVSSVDFSHYLSEKQARPIDYLSANVLAAVNSQSVSLIKADSTQALAAMMAFLETKGANQNVDLQVFNTRDFSNNNDYTTGYVSGFWGVKNNASGHLNDNQPITLLFVGDIMLSRTVGAIMSKNNDWKYPFLLTGDFLSSADLTFGNLEGPISENGIRAGSKYSFRADPRAVEGLLYAGFDVLSIANNHIWDYGLKAFQDTLKILNDNGISYIGGGENYEKAREPVVKEVKGLKIAFLGYTNLASKFLLTRDSQPAVAGLDVSQLIRDARKARELADVVVVSFHWGDEYAVKHNKEQEKIARAAIDAGADLVIGHHPHVVQETENYGSGYIAYSLGNFVFDQNFSKDTKNGLAVRVILKNKKIFEVQELPVKFTASFQPFSTSP